MTQAEIDTELDAAMSELEDAYLRLDALRSAIIKAHGDPGEDYAGDLLEYQHSAFRARVGPLALISHALGQLCARASIHALADYAREDAV